MSRSSRSAAPLLAAVALLVLLLVLPGIGMATSAPSPAIPTPLSARKVAPQLSGNATAIDYACQGAYVAVGAFVGGLAGVVAGYELAQDLCQLYGLAYPTTTEQAQNWTESVLAGLGNEVNLTAGATRNELQALILDQGAFDFAASNAALRQLNSSTFSTSQDLAESQVSSQLANFEGVQIAQLVWEVRAWDHWYAVNMGTGGQYNAVPTPVYAESAYNTGEALSLSGNNFTGGIDYPANTTLWIQGGSFVSGPVGGRCPVWGTTVFTAVAGGGGRNQSIDIPCGGTPFTGPTGVYVASHEVVYQDAIQADNLLGGGGTPVLGISDLGNGEWFGGLSLGAGKYNYQIESGLLSESSTLGNTLISMESTAANTAQAYWSAMRALGYRNASQVPPTCTILTPGQLLQGVNLTGLTPQEIMSLYYAALQAQAAFYNTTLGAGNFCGQGGRHFNFGNATWFDLAVNATGYVYTPGTPGEDLQIPSTWAYYGQLLLSPTISSVSIPVNRSWSPYASNPLQVFVNKPGQLISNSTWLGHVTGSTNDPSGTTLTCLSCNSSADYWIHLTSCTENGVATSSCGVVVSSINNTITNITCPTGQGNGGCTSPPPPVTPILVTLPSWLGWIGGFWSWITGLFGGGLLGSLMGAIVGAILLIAIILLVVVLVVAFFRWVLGMITGQGRGKSYVETLTGTSRRKTGSSTGKSRSSAGKGAG